MHAYAAPLAEMRFVMDEVAGFADVAGLAGFEELSPDLLVAVLAEGGRFAAEVLAPLNRIGDTQGARIENGVVRTPDGWREAYAAFVAGGWNGAPFAPEHGGQGLPWLVSTALSEMWQAANLGFSLCSLLTQGAIELLEAHGSEEQKALYLGRMVTGEWTGTMNLTEPQAGSDVGALRTRAVRDGDRWRLTGQKIFITYGDHDLTENVVHMVLARTPDAPAGIRGVSLFLVPKMMVGADGTLGARNDLRAAALEHKLGIHASPTCVMSYGDDGGAVGWLVGEENRGIEYMFTMMNSARLAVGLQGLSITERAYQQARAFARERVQGRDAVAGGREAVAIIRHPDVRRMLTTMKANAEGLRALVYTVAARQDEARRRTDSEGAARAQRFVDLMIPVVKAHLTDVGVEMASLGIQVHGGMGFVEETGAAQHYRDARIAPIYEGTNGIQAIDLLGRKLMRDGGAAFAELVAEMRADLDRLAGAPGDDAAAIAAGLAMAVDTVERTGAWLREAYGADPAVALAGATPFLRLLGGAACAWLLARGAAAALRRLAAGPADADFLDAKIVTARFYVEHLLPPALALEGPIVAGGRSALALDDTMF